MHINKIAIEQNEDIATPNAHSRFLFMVASKHGIAMAVKSV
jgi:hypothetical protein